MWTLRPPISKEIELPAWADVVAISSAAMTNSFFMRASFRRVGGKQIGERELALTLRGTDGCFCDARHPTRRLVTGSR
jgi:hypothetical protein